MKTFYAFFMFLFFILSPVGFVPAFAQQQAPSTADIIAKMQKKLNLTQDQVAAVSPIIEKYFSKREELRQSMQNPPADKDSISSQMKLLKDKEKQELSQFLSAEQLSQWEQMQSQGRHKHSSGTHEEGSWRFGEGNEEN
jgi:predicted nucleic acid-binding Zn ribbon protein